jgi:Flp pilus assembly pilin Flp
MLYLYCRLVTSSRRDDRGASAVEYGLLVALAAAACIGAGETLGATVPQVLEQTTSEVSFGGIP